MDLNIVTLPVFVAKGTGEHAAGTSVTALFRIPTNSNGGGITLKSVDFTSNAAIAAASAPQYELVGLGTACAVAGTLTTALASAAWTAGTARVGTISTAFVDPDTYSFIGVQEKVPTTLVLDANIVVSIQYVMGR